METALHNDSSPTSNGWRLTYHLFDYNLDFFEVGTLDDPAWKIEDPRLRYIQRALAARAGLWGNHGYEAAYAMIYEDADGRAPRAASTPTGCASTTLPPVGAFWSVTMYDIPDFFLVDNADRPLLDRRPHPRPASTRRTGSLTIAMQRDAPEDPVARANWLPAPDGAVPADPAPVRARRGGASTGRYELPAITRLDAPPA